jgi:hypothetical protein
VAAPFLNSRRLRDYPRLIAIAIWGVMIFNAIFGEGWYGKFGRITSYDFLTLYSAGYLYRTDIAHLYDISSMADTEQSIFHPSSLQGGVNLFSSPPYVAMLYSPFTLLPYGWAFAIWLVLSLVFALSAALVMQRGLAPAYLKTAALSPVQMAVLTLSFFPMLIGIFLGQNNSLTLLLMAAGLFFMLSQRPGWAGIMLGLLVYKPHYVIGLLLIWLVWKQWRALAGFCLTALVIAGGVLLTYGASPYIDYLQYSGTLMYLPLGASGMETTLFALVASLLPKTAIPSLSILNLGFVILMACFLGWLAYWTRKTGIAQDLVIGLGVLFPFFTAPHTLHYDLVLLIPVLLLWSRYERSSTVLWASIVIYLGAFLLPAISRPLDVGLLALLPLALGAMLLHRFFIVRCRHQNQVSTI